MILPVEDRENTIKVGPAWTALADGLEVPRPGVTASISHDDALDVLCVYQFLHFSLEI